MGRVSKTVTVLGTVAPVVIEMVRKYWPQVRRTLEDNPEIVRAAQDQLRRLAELRRKNTPESIADRINVLGDQVNYLAASADSDREAQEAELLRKQLARFHASLGVLDGATQRTRTRELRHISAGLDRLTETIISRFIEEQAEDQRRSPRS